MKINMGCKCVIQNAGSYGISNMHEGFSTISVTWSKSYMKINIGCKYVTQNSDQ